MNIKLFIINIIIIIIIIIIIKKYFYNEAFNNYDNFIDYQVIHMSENTDRNENITKMSKYINQNINIFEAVKGKNVNLKKLYNFDEKINFNFYYKTKGEIGCYLSHLMLLKKLKNSNYKYCLILEDDFKIDDTNFHNNIIKLINNIDDEFDLLFIGNLNNNHGKHYKDNIYFINPNEYMWGTHGYIINISNINKIYNELLNIDLAIDNKYKKLIDNKILKGFVIYPILVNINDYPTTVGLSSLFS